MAAYKRQRTTAPQKNFNLVQPTQRVWGDWRQSCIKRRLVEEQLIGWAWWGGGRGGGPHFVSIFIVLGLGLSGSKWILVYFNYY